MGHSDEWTFADYFKYEQEIYRAIISAAVLCQWIAEHDTPPTDGEAEALIILNFGITRPFPALGNNGDLRTNGIYGPKCSALSGNCTPLGCLEKMLLASSIWGSTRRFLTWSRQATPLGFSYFLLSPSAHGMSAKELSSSAMLLPTPLASDTGDVGKTVDVRMTPTGSFRKYNPSGTVWTARLSWAVYKLLGSPPGDVKLNPDWVEWLMGFPRRWTDIPCGPKNRRKSRT